MLALLDEVSLTVGHDLRLLIRPTLLVVVLVVRVVARDVRIGDVTICVVVDPHDPGALYALAVLLLYELAATVNHSEIDGASIIE